MDNASKELLMPRKAGDIGAEIERSLEKNTDFPGPSGLNLLELAPAPRDSRTPLFG